MEPGSSGSCGGLHLRDSREFLPRVIIGADGRFVAAVVRALMWPASVVYGGVVALRNLMYGLGLLPVRRLPGPAISIGNVSVGGTGKTPMAAWVAQRLLEMGRRPAILSRGYGAKVGGDGVPRNDEAAMPAEGEGSVSHWCDPDRLRAAERAARGSGADCFVLDDAFQHRRAGRDLDIVLLDASVPRRAMRLLPRGALREPMSSLRRADVVVITHADLCEAARLEAMRGLIAGENPRACAAEAVHRAVSLSRLGGGDDEPAESVRDRRVFAFCGIGNPASFTLTLQALGAEVLGAAYYPDHHGYTQNDCDTIVAEAGQCGADLLVTTWKDAVKLGGMWSDERLRILKVEMAVVRGREEMLARIRGAVTRSGE